MSFGFGVTPPTAEVAKLLMCLVPLICAYVVDLIGLHIMVRIITIGAYLERSGNPYERFAFAVRDQRGANPFVFEAVVLHGSSLGFNVIILVLAFAFARVFPNWPSEYMVAYALAGVLGIGVTVFSWMMYTMRAKEIREVAKKVFGGDRTPPPGR